VTNEKPYGKGIIGAMNEPLKLGEKIEARYARMVLRVRQKEDHLQVSVYDSKSPQPDKPVWESESQGLEDAKNTALLAAREYLASRLEQI
jgi:hypothetical protein